MSPELIERRQVYAGYLRVERLRLLYPDGSIAVREVESHGEAVAVLPYDPAARTAMFVRLFRAPALAEVEEACAGMIDGEDADATARREALEEMGLRIGELEPVGRVWPSPGVSSERVTLFLASYAPADRVSGGGGLADEHENITVLERDLRSLASQADAGLIADLKLLTLVQSLRARRPDLFTDPPA